jgi:hypothetical protein
VQLFSKGKRGRRCGGSTVLEVDDTVKSGAELGRLKAAVGVWRSKMTKGNWVIGPNCWLGQWKNMILSMRWARKIGEKILAGQNWKEKKGNKNRERFFGCWKLEMWFKWVLI